MICADLNVISFTGLTLKIHANGQLYAIVIVYFLALFDNTRRARHNSNNRTNTIGNKYMKYYVSVSNVRTHNYGASKEVKSVELV